MKRWLVYLAVLVLCGTSANRGTDIGELAPVEVVWLTENAGQVCLKTDTGDIGRGEDVPSALCNMKATASGNILLETADYLIVELGKEDLLSQVYDLLRPSCKVCVARSMPDLEKVAVFFTAHEPEVTLRQYQVEQSILPVLGEQEGRFAWIGE